MDARPRARLALRAAPAREVAHLRLELRHTPQQPPAVDLELRLTGTTRADATRLLAERGAAAAQTWQPVPQLGQLDLRLALVAVLVLSEDVEDHRGAVDGRAPEDLLEVAALGGRELVVEHDSVGVDRLGDGAQLLGLAAADVGGGIGGVATLQHSLDLVGAGCVDEQRQLVERRLGLVDGRGRHRHPDEHDALAVMALDERHWAASGGRPADGRALLSGSLAFGSLT